MKLLLTSGGLANQSIINTLKDLAGKPFDQLNLAFIPTASNVEPGDKWWLINDLEVCKKLGFKEIDILDISAIPKSLWQPRLNHADVLLFEGGNTYHLMYWVNQSGLIKVLPELLKTKVYVGISAGSMIPSPQIISTHDKKYVIELGETIYDKALNLVDFYIEPHVNSSYFPEHTFASVEKLAQKENKTIYALDDQSAVKVVDGNISVISEGVWQKLN